MFEQTAYCLIGKIAAQHRSGDRNRYPIRSNVDFYGSTCGKMLTEFLIHPNVGFLRRSGCTVMLEPPPKFIRLADIMPDVAVA